MNLKRWEGWGLPESEILTRKRQQWSLRGTGVLLCQQSCGQCAVEVSAAIFGI